MRTGSTVPASAIARRLGAEPIALVAAVRADYSTPFDEARLPVLELGRLSAASASQLLDRIATELHPVLRARVLAEATGNPLALVELARTLPPSGAAGIGLSAEPPTLTLRLERAFAARLDDLREATRMCLLVAALDGRASLDEVVRCAAVLLERPVEISALDPAAEAGLMDVVGTEVHFRHPLVRSAVRQAALPPRALAMYGALAEVVADPERQLRHRAMATVGFDEQLADALDEHFQRREAPRSGAVAAALERAAALTADPQ